jgi:tetratricopeptide (TPR) repeat protein
MKTIDFSYFIERYNAGEMDESEKQWFITELDNNKNLRKEVELRNKTDAILKNKDLMNLRNKLNEIEKKRAVAEPVKKPKRAFNIKYAAVITGFVIIAGISIISNRKMSSDEIIDRYYKPYEATTSSRSEAVAGNVDYSLALEYYSIHDYRNAAIYFNRVIENEPENMYSALLSGISNFEIKNYPEAEGSFLKVIANNNNYFIDHAQWYLALCYLRTDRKILARDQLAIIEKSRTIYRKDAKKILRSLK